VPVGDVAAAAARTQSFLSKRPAVPSTHPYTLAAMQAATLAVYDSVMGA
jgi:hypothetical protein